MYYKKFINENSKYVKIDDKHSCTEEQLHAFMSFLFQNFKEQCMLRTILGKKKMSNEPGVDPKEIELSYPFEEAIMDAYISQKATRTSALYENISEFMNDTLSE